MKHYFKTENEARKFAIKQTQGLQKIDTEILTVLAEGIIYQEHSSYFNFDSNVRYNISLVQFHDRYEIEISTKKYSLMVLAAEIGDLKLFKEEFAKRPSNEALSLAFVTAIQNEKLNILQFYFDTDIVKNISLFKEPIFTATRGDKINSFEFFLRKDMKLPKEILGPIFQDNSVLILRFIIQHPVLSKEILEEKFKTTWAIDCLRKKDNEATRMFKNFAAENS